MSAASTTSIQIHQKILDNASQQDKNENSEDSDIEEITEEYLNSLLEKAKANTAAVSGKHAETNTLGEEIRFDEEERDL